MKDSRTRSKVIPLEPSSSAKAKVARPERRREGGDDGDDQVAGRGERAQDAR